MNEQELNKKLAEWVGLDTKHKWVAGGFGMMECSKCGIGKNLKLYKYCNFPDFTRSLKACFDWLAPSLDNPVIKFRMHFNGSEWYSYIGIDHSPWESEEYGDTSAMAFCLAIEKLIDSEVN